MPQVNELDNQNRAEGDIMMVEKNYDIKDEWFFEKQSSLVTTKVKGE